MAGDLVLRQSVALHCEPFGHHLHMLSMVSDAQASTPHSCANARHSTIHRPYPGRLLPYSCTLVSPRTTAAAGLLLPPYAVTSHRHPLPACYCLPTPSHRTATDSPALPMMCHSSTSSGTESISPPFPRSLPCHWSCPPPHGCQITYTRLAPPSLSSQCPPWPPFPLLPSPSAAHTPFHVFMEPLSKLLLVPPRRHHRH